MNEEDAYEEKRIDILLAKSEYSKGETLEGKVLLELPKEVNARGIYAILQKIETYQQLPFRRRPMFTDVAIYEEKKVIGADGTYFGKKEYPFNFVLPHDIKSDFMKVFIGRLPDSFLVSVGCLVSLAGAVYNITTPAIIRKIGESGTVTEGGNTLVGFILLILAFGCLYFISRPPLRNRWKISTKLDIQMGIDICKEKEITVK